nr:MAG: capsid protein [Picornaviridae sp.]
MWTEASSWRGAGGLYSSANTTTSAMMSTHQQSGHGVGNSTNPTISGSEQVNLESDDAPIVELYAGAGDQEVVPPSLIPYRPFPDDFALSHFFARPRRVLSVSASADTTDTLWNLFSNVPDVATILSNYTLWRGNPYVTLVYTGSPNVMGMVRMCFQPFYQTGDPYGGLPYIRTSAFVGASYLCENSVLPHIDLDLSSSCTCSIQLPFSGPQRFFSIGGDSDYTFRMVPINPIVSVQGATPPTINIDMYLHYNDFELAVITPQGKKGAPEANPWSLSALSEYAAMVAELTPHPVSLPVAGLLRGIGGVAKFFGYARPPSTAANQIIARKHCNSAAASGQPDLGFQLGLDPSVMHDVSGQMIPLKRFGDTTVDYLKNVPGQLIKDWQPEAALEVSPFLYCEGGLADCVLTPVGFVSSCFRLWTGNLSFTIQVKGSPLVRWRIGLVVLPPGVAAPLTFPDHGFISKVVDIAGSLDVEFEVPYLYADDFQEARLTYCNNAATPPLATTRIIYYSLMDAVSPSPTPVYPYINLWMRAGKDFSLGVPGLELFNGWHFGDTGIVPQGLGGQSTAKFGEVVDDLTLLTRRMGRRYLLDVGSAFDRIMKFPIRPFTPNVIGNVGGRPTTFQSWTFEGYIPTAYYGLTGGTRLAFTPSNVSNPTSVGVYYSIPGDMAITPTTQGRDMYGMQFFEPEEGRILEVSIPDKNYKAFRYAGARNNAHGGVPVWVATLEVPSGSTTRVWSAGADDFSFGGFLCAPRMRLSS